MVNWDGRKLPVEKIHFGKTQVLAGEEADWGRDAVKSRLISTVTKINLYLEGLAKLMCEYMNMLQQLLPIPHNRPECSATEQKSRFYHCVLFVVFLVKLVYVSIKICLDTQ